MGIVTGSGQLDASCDPIEARGPRVLLVSSSGGVLDDLMAMATWWRDLDRRWVAVRAPDTLELLAAESVEWAEDATLSHPVQLARSVASAQRDLARRPVDLIVSAGTAVAGTAL